MSKPNRSTAPSQAAGNTSAPHADPSHDLTGLRAVLSSKGSASYATMSPLEFLVYAESCEERRGHVLSDMLRDIEATVAIVKALLFAGMGDEKDEIDTVLWVLVRRVRAAGSLSEALTAEAK